MVFTSSLLDSEDYCGGCPWLFKTTRCYHYLQAELSFQMASEACQLFGGVRMADPQTDWYMFEELKKVAYTRYY